MIARTLHGPDGAVRIARRRLLPKRTQPGAPNLQHADLHGQDLRGLDFSGADLRHADLRGARLGVPARAQLALLMLAVLTSVLSGLASGVAGNTLHEWIASQDVKRRMLGVFIAAELSVFFVAAIWKGLHFATRWLLPPIAALVLAASAVGVSIGESGAGGLSILVFSTLIGALLCLGVLARAIAGTASQLLFVLVAAAGALSARTIGGGVTALALAVTSMLVARRALEDERGAPRLTRWTLAAACARGTSFRRADLRGARFGRAVVRCCDFRGAKLEGADLGQAHPVLSRFDGAARAPAASTAIAADDARPEQPFSARADTHPPLCSWNDGRAKRAILDFVARVTRSGSAEFVPAAERIAVFDNDGTLWSEQPLYVQLTFAFDRVKALAPRHPEWSHTQPFQGVLEGDMRAVAESGQRGLMELIAATHVGNTTEEFEHIVKSWVVSARHPRFDRLHTELVYQPMLELLAYLRNHDFRTFVVTGGGVEFVRPWVERTYGIVPEQVIGSRAKLRYELRDGRPVLARLPVVDLYDDHAGKPVGIQQVVGRRPIAAFGNADGDYEMLEWTTSARPGLGVVVHHTDAEREWAYDREVHIGRLARVLDEAPARSWVVVDMKRDWNVVYPFQQRGDRA